MKLIVTDVQNGGTSLLESEAVEPSTQRDYVRRLKVFDDFCTSTGLVVLPSSSDDTIELAALDYLDHIFLLELPIDAGTKFMAALAARWARLHRPARSGRLPRLRRALQGFGRLNPASTRLPIPMVLVHALAAVLTPHYYEAALLLLLAADAYLRPGEVVDLSTDSVIPAQNWLGQGYAMVTLLLHPAASGQMSKMHCFDDSVVLDSKSAPWLAPLVVKLAQQRGPGVPLFQFTAADMNKLIVAALMTLGLQDWDVTLYAMRHAGPSHDHLMKLRPLEEIQRRGRWASMKSCRRYEKSSQIMSQLNKIPKSKLVFIRQASLDIAEILRGTVSPPFCVPIQK